MNPAVKIDELIEVVRQGGVVKTGVDVYSSRDVLLIAKDVLIKSVNALLTLKQNGLMEVPVDYKNSGGIWNKKGKLVDIKPDPAASGNGKKKTVSSPKSKRLREITQLKKEAKAFHDHAKENVRKIIDEIKQTGGQFDQTIMESTIDDIFAFLASHGNALNYLAKELYSYDEYLYTHSVNVCTLGTTVLLQFNEHFGQLINQQLNHLFTDNGRLKLNGDATSYILYYPEELKEIAMGMFLHDIGKVLVSEQILNKQGVLTLDEKKLFNSHSSEFGKVILGKNGIQNAFIHNVVKYHHSALFKDEKDTYPVEKLPIEIPPYVKICKLVDCYDTLTTGISSKDAESPVTAVTQIFRKYAGKEDIMLQLVLHAFVKVVGIYPSCSVVYLRNGQMAYVIDSDGPICIPFTDRYGNAVSEQQEPVDISTVGEEEMGLSIDRRRPPLSPKRAYDILPDYLREI